MPPCGFNRRHWGPFRLECVPLDTDLADVDDIVVLTPDQILDWAEFGPEGDAPIKGGSPIAADACWKKPASQAEGAPSSAAVVASGIQPRRRERTIV